MVACMQLCDGMIGTFKLLPHISFHCSHRDSETMYHWLASHEVAFAGEPLMDGRCLCRAECGSFQASSYKGSTPFLLFAFVTYQ